MLQFLIRLTIIIL